MWKIAQNLVRQVMILLVLTVPNRHLVFGQFGVTREGIEESVQQVITDDGGEAEALNEHVVFLAKVYYGDEARFYRQIFDELEESKSLKSLPALEALLSRQDFLDGEVHDREARNLLRYARQRATPLWYELRWQNATLEEKIETVLYGVRPNPPIAPHHDVSVKKITELGKVVRPALYQLLLDVQLEFDVRPWSVIAASHFEQLLREPVFRPTDKEIRQIFEQGGEYGIFVMLGYAAHHRQHPMTLEALRRWFDNHREEPDKLTSPALDTRYFHKSPAEVRLQLFPILVDMGRHAQQQALEDSRRILEWADLLATIHLVFRELPVDERAVGYLREYQQARKAWDLSFLEEREERYARGVRRTLEIADQRAAAVLERQE